MEKWACQISFHRNKWNNEFSYFTKAEMLLIISKNIDIYFFTCRCLFQQQIMLKHLEIYLVKLEIWLVWDLNECSSPPLALALITGHLTNLGSIFTSLRKRGPAASHQESQREDPSCLHSLLKTYISPWSYTGESDINVISEMISQRLYSWSDATSQSLYINDDCHLTVLILCICSRWWDDLFLICMAWTLPCM